MIYQDVEFFLEENEKKLPKESIRYLYFQLLALNDYRQERILRLQLKSPTGAFLLSFFFGCYGFDRFYIGDIGLGFLKLLTFGGCGIWTIIDWFKISGMTKQRNYDKILEYL